MAGLPLRLVSRTWGLINDVPLPAALRDWILSTYVNAFQCDLDDIDTPLSSFPTLGAFFTRRLRPGARPIDASAPIVSPTDSRVLSFGEVDPSTDTTLQVKGVPYSVRQLLDMHGSQMRLKPKENRLYHIILYLAPGDYHGIHAPAKMQVLQRRHFPGDMFSVSKPVAHIIPGLFALNERVALLGVWKHGFIASVAVAATNVGDIETAWEPDVVTNTPMYKRRLVPEETVCTSTADGSAYYSRTYKGNDVVYVDSGERTGGFRLGSTVVLVFEAPPSFTFTVEEGEKVKLGQALGRLR